EAPPILQELAAELADAAGAEAVLAADVLGALAEHQVVQQPAVPLGARPPPGGAVGAEGHLLRHGGLGVVFQSLSEDVAEQAAAGGERLDREAAPLLAPRHSTAPDPPRPPRARAPRHAPGGAPA